MKSRKQDLDDMKQKVNSKIKKRNKEQKIEDMNMMDEKGGRGEEVRKRV